MTTTMPCGAPVDLQHLKGQEHVKRALEVAAAGGHHLLLMALCADAQRHRRAGSWQDHAGPRPARPAAAALRE